LDVKRIGLAIACLVGIVAAPGCGGQDPGQPAVGSISIKPKADDDGLPGVKKAPKSARNKD
jgi:hypothetical protein